MSEQNKPPNFRDSEECTICIHCKCTHICGCCPSEYMCIKYPGQYISECMICDDYEEEK